MAAFNIPLDYKPPQITPPAQAVGQVLDIQGLTEQNQLRQQQLQQNQIAMQQAAFSSAAQRALNLAMQQNLTKNPDGTMTLDHNGVMNQLTQMGFGTVGQQYGKQMQDYLGAVAKTRAESIGADQKAAESLTQGLNAVNDDQTYQAWKAQAAPQMQRWGINLNAPPAYDPVWVGQAKAKGTTIKDTLSAAKDANELMEWQATGLQKTAADFAASQQKALSVATNQGDLDRINSKGQAIINSLPPAARGPFLAVQNSIPNAWSADIPLRYSNQLMTPEQRQAYEDKNTSDAASMLYARGDTKEGYAAAYNAISDPNVRAKFRPPDQWDDTAGDEALQVGSKPNEIATLASNQAYRDAQQTISRQRLGIQASRLDLERTRQAQGTSAQQDQAQRLMRQSEDQEDAINRQRQFLGDALMGQNQQSYINDKGQLVPFQAGTSDQTKAEVRTHMLAQYDATNQQLKRVIADKYNQAGRLGIQPSISLNEVNAAIDQGDQQLHKSLTKGTGTQQAPPTAKAAASPTPASPAPAAPASRAVPPQAIIDQWPVGTHTLRNGQVWQKNPDGTAKLIQAAQ